MIEKYIPTSWEYGQLAEPSTKTASYAPDHYVPPDMADKIKTLQTASADPRFTYLHMIAMTDGDYYGSNLNGDVFDQSELTGTQSAEEAAKNKGELKGVPVPRYKTFEQAKFFRNHANSDHDPFYGDICFSCWNDLMKRVELLARIARDVIPELGMQSGADILKKLDRRGYITTSMGTSITHETCSVCNASNEFVPDRCVHLKNQMNDVLPDGRKVFARNFGMRFFDQSDVGIPADPGAYSLCKVASACCSPNPAKDVAIPSAWSIKRSDMEKQIPLIGSSVGSVPLKDDVGINPLLLTDAAYTVDEIKRAMAEAGGINGLLSTAAAAGIVFSPVELGVATTLSEPEKTASDDFDGFTRIALDNFSAGAYAVLQSKIAERSGYVAPLIISGWSPAKLASQGVEGLANYYAAYRHALRSLSADSFVKAAQRIPALRELAASGRSVEAMNFLSYAGLL